MNETSQAGSSGLALLIVAMITIYVIRNTQAQADTNGAACPEEPRRDRHFRRFGSG